MTNTELELNMLAKVAATDVSDDRNPQNYDESIDVAAEGAALAARRQIERSTGKSPITECERLTKDHKSIEENCTPQDSVNNNFHYIIRPWAHIRALIRMRSHTPLHIENKPDRDIRRGVWKYALSRSLFLGAKYCTHTHGKKTGSRHLLGWIIQPVVCTRSIGAGWN